MNKINILKDSTNKLIDSDKNKYIIPTSTLFMVLFVLVVL